MESLLKLLDPFEARCEEAMGHLAAQKQALWSQIQMYFNENENSPDERQRMKAACGLWVVQNARHAEMMSVLNLFLQSKTVWTNFLSTATQ